MNSLPKLGCSSRGSWPQKKKVWETVVQSCHKSSSRALSHGLNTGTGYWSSINSYWFKFAKKKINKICSDLILSQKTLYFIMLCHLSAPQWLYCLQVFPSSGIPFKSSRRKFLASYCVRAHSTEVWSDVCSWSASKSCCWLSGSEWTDTTTKHEIPISFCKTIMKE